MRRVSCLDRNHKPAVKSRWLFCLPNSMPILAPKPCRHPGCGVLVRDGGGYCEAHKRVTKKEVESRRESSTKRGYGYKWQKARDQYLKDHPLCVDCETVGRLVPATEVDHKIPHRLTEALESGNQEQIATAQSLFWNQRNWQGLCKPCHSSKTAREDGRWGRG